ncbi:SPOR domain-containing protein [Fulvivirga sediminis]|uniref:SPOR domain-containing protein n=1 Tax=Fulvivirga sediminis TaxID=2803949 RepID=A0A937JZ94_9BACT|nr:SPOR domain-containing protein [Fulvivirga sediminis]MBL3654941.1 SPOR domain-containing protein [Fulvivirga sediminis]
MKKTVLYCLVGFALLTACSPKTSTSSSSGEAYKEDLKAYRPVYEKPEERHDTLSNQAHASYADVNIEPTNDVTKPLNNVLDEIDDLRSNTRYIDGFTIQVYSGTNREDARLARGKVFSVLPESNPSLKFDEPNFKVKVGKYYSKLEAQKPYAQLKKRFPGALIIPERIYIQ